MTMVKRCIIIDNEDQSATREKLERDLKSKTGIKLECYEFNIGSPKLVEVLTDDSKIDIDKVVEVYRERYKGITFHLAAFDWHLDDDDITGAELIRQFTSKKILINTPKIIYSGLIDEILKDLQKDQHYIRKVKSLIKNDIKGFYDRDNRDPEIINFFKKNLESLDIIVEEELRKSPDYIYHNPKVNPKFDNISFGDLADYLDEHKIIKNDFKRELVAQIIAYIAEDISN